ATKLGLWLLDARSSVGIPKTKPEHHAAPYCLTEDFVTVYRLHPLLPDDYVFHDHASGKQIDSRFFTDIQGRETDNEMRRIGLTNALYSFGIAHPGAITLHNYPNALRQFNRDGEIIDLAVVDLVRTRRRQSDRFVTVDFRPEIYSPFGMDWIEQNGMTSVILRHCPELASMTPRDARAFAPWRPVPVRTT